MQATAGRILNIQRYCIDDGPGIRTTVFLKGCPLHCMWCHNPEGWEERPTLLYDDAVCIRCGRCKQACPTGAISCSVIKDKNNTKIHG